MNENTTQDSEKMAASGSQCSAWLGRGWWNPRPFDTRSKFHFADHSGRSLCGRYGAIGVDVFEYGKDDHRDNCAACKRRIAALKNQAP